VAPMTVLGWTGPAISRLGIGTRAIVGFRNPGQVAGLAGSGDIALSEEQLSRLNAATSNRTDALS
jgi:hypothetical protein